MNAPNKITVTRLVIAIVMIAFLIVPWWPKEMVTPIASLANLDKVQYVPFSIVELVAMVLFVLAASTDAVDGHLARKYNLVTDFGKFFDPLADKFLINSALILLAVRQPNDLPAIIVVLMVGRDLAVDGLRFIASTKGEVIAANIFGKIKTVMQMIVIPIIMVHGFPFSTFMGEYTYIICIVLASITCAMSLVSGIIYIYRGRHLLKGGSK